MTSSTTSPTAATRNYAIVTAAYWGFTLTDGALRMLVLLHFFRLGYSPLTLAFLFLLYEAAGIAANLVGGYLEQHPDAGPEISFGALALDLVEGRFARHLLESFQAGRTSLRAAVDADSHRLQHA